MGNHGRCLTGEILSATTCYSKALGLKHYGEKRSIVHSVHINCLLHSASFTESSHVRLTNLDGGWSSGSLDSCQRLAKGS